MNIESADIDIEKEWLVQFCMEKLKSGHFDYLIFGHRHLMLDISLTDGARYINLGDWFTFNSYAEFDGTKLALLKW